MLTRTAIKVGDAEWKAVEQIAPELVRNLLEFKLDVRKNVEQIIVVNGEVVTKFSGSFKSIDFKWSVQTNSSWYVEQMRMLIDQNDAFEYEV